LNVNVLKSNPKYIEGNRKRMNNYYINIGKGIIILTGSSYLHHGFYCKKELFLNIDKNKG
jgi:hypothetical protein